MKKVIITSLAFFLLITMATAQEDKKEYHENGQLKSIGSYNLTNEISGEKFGLWKFYYDNGQLESEGYLVDSHFENNKLLEWKYYYRNGKLKSIGSYSFTNVGGRKTGEWREYNENTKLLSLENYSIDVNYPQSKKKFYYYDTGELEFTYSTVTASLKGYYENFWKNGKLSQTGELIDGKQSGEWKYFYVNGKIIGTYIWEYDKLMNVKELYDMNGNSMDTSTLKNGNGFLKHYNDDGKLFQMTVKDGVIVQDEPVD